MKAVLDTNVLISALFWRGTPYRCLLTAELGLYELILCQEIINELEKVLSTKLNLPPVKVQDSIVKVCKIGRIVSIGDRIQVCYDPKDNMCLEAAQAAGAEFIVSGDKHLLTLGQYRKSQIVAPAEFLKIFQE
jgi:uncharacterized protein